MHATLRTRLAPGLLAGALVLVPLAGCSFTSNGFSCSGSSCTVTLDGEGSEVDILGQTVTLGGVQDGRATISVGGASVSCGGGAAGTAGRAASRGRAVPLGGAREGRATISVGGASVSCGEGESVTAGPLALECTSVTDGALELRARPNYRRAPPPPPPP